MPRKKSFFFSNQGKEKGGFGFNARDHNVERGTCKDGKGKVFLSLSLCDWSIKSIFAR